jgi:hypothetical protein
MATMSGDEDEAAGEGADAGEASDDEPVAAGSVADRRRGLRVALGATAVVALIVAGALLYLAAGGNDSPREAPPEVATVAIPQLGLPPGSTAGTMQISSYSPGRSVQLVILTTTPNTAEGDSLGTQSPGADLRMTVTDASLSDVAHRYGFTNAEQATSVGIHAALSYPAFPPTAPYPAVPFPALPYPPLRIGPDPTATVAWQPAPHVVAELTMGDLNGTEAARRAATLLASTLVELDDATWWNLLNPSPAASWSGLAAPDGVGELAVLNTGSQAVQVLDTPKWAPGTFMLTTTLGDPNPDNFNGTGPEDLDVRGTRGVITDTPSYLRSAHGPSYTRRLSWVQDRALYSLDFTAAASPADAVKVADRLSILTDAQWHALLFPAMLRTDLVPLPEITRQVTNVEPTDPNAVSPTSSRPPTDTSGP